MEKIRMINPEYIRFVWKTHRGLTLFSTIFVGAMQFLILYLFTTLDYAPIMDVILKQLPPQFRVLFNSEFLQRVSAEGAAAFGFNHPLVLAVLGLTAISLPARHIAGEIENGTLELLLANPLSRTSHILSVWLATASSLLIIVLFGLVGSISALVIFYDLSGSITIGLLKITLNLWLLFVMISSYTLLLSAFEKESGRTGTRSAAITLVFYLAYVIAVMWDSIAVIKPYIIFTYYQPQKLMFDERSLLENLIVLSILTVILLVPAIRHFNKRDIPG